MSLYISCSRCNEALGNVRILNLTVSYVPLPLFFSLYNHVTLLHNIHSIQNQLSTFVQQNNQIKNLGNTQKNFCVIVLFKIKWLSFSLHLYWKELQCRCCKLGFSERTSWQLLLSIQAIDFPCVLKNVFNVTNNWDKI